MQFCERELAQRSYGNLLQDPETFSSDRGTKQENPVRGARPGFQGKSAARERRRLSELCIARVNRSAQRETPARGNLAGVSRLLTPAETGYKRCIVQ
jgi:hypothetical protein